jgi:hypothetical protein
MAFNVSMSFRRRRVSAGERLPTRFATISSPSAVLTRQVSPDSLRPKRLSHVSCAVTAEALAIVAISAHN